MKHLDTIYAILKVLATLAACVLLLWMICYMMREGI